MPTTKQIEANRRNAQKSTGPRTLEGKKRSRLNAGRHLFTAQVTVMPAEDRAAHQVFCADLVQSLNPATPMERQIAQSIASDQWRLNRMRALEDNLFALGLEGEPGNIETEHSEIHTALAAARVFLEDPRRFDLLSLYIQRTSRQLERSIELLSKLQNERRAIRAHALDEAVRLKEACAERNMPFNPTTYPTLRADITGDKPQTGFDFSDTQIESFRFHQRNVERPEKPFIVSRKAA